VFTFLLKPEVSQTQTRLPLHRLMTEEELKFYFGDQDLSDIEQNYDLGLLKKVEDSGVDIARTRSNIVSQILLEDGEEYIFQAFNLTRMLNLKTNELLVSNRANIAWIGEDGKETRKNVNTSKLGCHKIHKAKDLMAAVSNCQEGKMTGFVSTPEDTFEFAPLTKRLKNKVKQQLINYYRAPLEDQGLDVDDFLVVKRVTFPNFTGSDSEFLEWTAEGSVIDVGDSDVLYPIDFGDDDYRIEELENQEDQGNANNKMIETAIFFDQVAYKRFSSVYSDEEIEDLLMAYINQVAAIYRMPSLGQEIDIMITYLEIQKTAQFKNMGGRRESLLNSFCEYSNTKNPMDDQSNPRHWDVGILVTGLDLWAEKNGVRADDTLGLARTNGMCHAKYSCVVVEFGVVGALGSSYPTTGFTASYTLAHELGHSLGMSHDKGFIGDGFIMSTKRLERGQTSWSPQSGESIRQNHRLTCLSDRPILPNHWDHNDTQLVPGYFYPADEQCRFFFHGKEASPAEEEEDDPERCQNLVCQHENDIQSTGPPLEGTSCGGEGTHWCRSGTCVPVQPFRWSPWRSGPCVSACTRDGTGTRKLTRQCLRLPGYEDQDCGDESEEAVLLCQDTQLCGVRRTGGRRTRAQLATLLCEQQAALLDTLDRSTPKGQAIPYEEDKPWQACVLYCKARGGEGWINPLGATFPDGTWCHYDGYNNYYCRAHQCISSNVTIAAGVP